MDSVANPKEKHSWRDRGDEFDLAANTMGAPAFGLYSWLLFHQTKYKIKNFFCWEVREVFNIKETSTLKKYLEQIADSRFARVIFAPRGDAFIFELWKAPTAAKVLDKEGPENSAQDRNFPFTADEPGNGGQPKKSVQGGKIPPGGESFGPRTEISGSRTPKDFGVVVDLNTPTPTSLEVEELTTIIKAAQDIPGDLNQVKFFLGQRFLEAALQYDVTLSIPGHLLHAWQDSLRFDGHNQVKAIYRVKNAILYCLQQKEIGLNIRNRVGYFFDAVKRARTPSNKPEKKEVLERVKPRERTAAEIHEENLLYWQSLSLEDLKEKFTTLKKMGLSAPSRNWLLEGAKLSRFQKEFLDWVNQ